MSTSTRHGSEPLRPPRLVPEVHTDFGELMIPFYDEELDVAQNHEHKDVIFYAGEMLRSVTVMAELWFHADNPIWYWDYQLGEQKVFYADLAISRAENPKAVTANDLLLVVEVVTTWHKAKMEKDTVRQRELNRRNLVPEFLLFFPDMDDDRILQWYFLDRQGRYILRQPVDGRYLSQSIPGLAIMPLPRESWEPGRKCRFFYKGTPLLPREDEHEARVEAERRAYHQLHQSEMAIAREQQARMAAQEEARAAVERARKAEEDAELTKKAASEANEAALREIEALERRLAEREG